jgi:hypothetical protein
MPASKTKKKTKPRRDQPISKGTAKPSHAQADPSAHQPHEAVHASTGDTTPIYTDEFVGGLVRCFEIKTEHIEPLKNFLNDAARIYKASAQVETRDRQQITIRNKLRLIEHAYNALAGLLDGLSSLERDRLWHPLWENPNRPQNLIGFASPFSPNEYEDESVFLQTLEAFGRRLQNRLADLRGVQDKGGRPERLALRAWVAYAAHFWETVLDREFTYYEFEGKPTKCKSYDFCFLAIAPLRLDITDEALKTAIRTVIKRKMKRVPIPLKSSAPDDAQ